MTEAERKMMNNIRLYGLSLALDDDSLNIALGFLEKLMEDEADGS